ncbi:class II 3-deoxy-7-phosphoheptulonate synthase [Iamia sp.]|uniref:class II 3-deoxy-7-phosphoheptulonate synthase n=1 Tax=Iamia sp. TaxID=2722710 RepID=UPI002CB3B260|nr:3-deoxy-7-phosphoheptulonate synthase class II [Iamia sp.]HXH56133.1 3-deoxy-7-phosphoheptulonate synthase class II [Iamia sp.]
MLTAERDADPTMRAVVDWRALPAAQQPEWPDEGHLQRVTKELAELPPLVFAAESRDLTGALARVAEGRAFLLQAGDCAESFTSFSAESVRRRLQVILQMAVVLTYSSGVPTVKIGRIAGQFAKPRSSGFETVDGVTLPSFRGHIVNDDAFTETARRPDPQRLLQAYHQSASTLNLLRSLTRGGFSDLNQVHSWTQDFVTATPQGQQYRALADEIGRALRFMTACGVDTASLPTLHRTDFFTSHEALLLPYEEALTRADPMSGDLYATSAHMIWIGERTRQLEGAHVAYFASVANPIGCKVGPTATADEVLELCERLNPDRIPGRLTLISRMGAAGIEDGLRPLLAAVRDAEHPVVWACDPMHGHTFTSDSGHKTRRVDDILDEIAGFFRAHEAEGTWAGGVHVELTSDDVTECLGGSHEILDSDLDARYETVCDPRLNGRQSLDLAFRVAEALRARSAA